MAGSVGAGLGDSETPGRGGAAPEDAGALEAGGADAVGAKAGVAEQEERGTGQHAVGTGTFRVRVKVEVVVFERSVGALWAEITLRPKKLIAAFLVACETSVNGFDAASAACLAGLTGVGRRQEVC